MSALDKEGAANEAPTTGEPDGEFIRLKKMVVEGHRARGDWRKEAQKCYNYVAGHQWDPDDEAKLKSENRPCITFNRTAPIIKAVCGLEVNNRQSVVYLPREQGDVGVNEVITSAGKWIRDECYAEDEESEAFRDTVICGEGWTETRMEYDEEPQGKVIKERIDPLEMGTNKGAKRANYSDAKLVYRVRDMDPNEARVLLDLDEEISAYAMHAHWMEDSLAVPEDGGEGNKRDYPSKTRDGVSTADGRTPAEVRIVHVQYWERERIHLVAQEGEEELQELSPEEFAKFEERVNMLNSTAEVPIAYESTVVPRKVFYECFLIQSAVVGKRKIEAGMFRFSAMTGEYDRKMKCFYGMVRDMFDPQMWANKWLAQTMHLMNSNAKGGLLAESDVFTNVRQAERDWADPTKIVTVKPGSLQKQKLKERQASNMPPGLDQLMVFAISSIRDVTGVNLELLGQADREQAASLEAQRRQSAMTVLATLFDSLRKYRKRDGKLTLHFIYLLPDGTLVRVVEKGQIKYIPLVKDVDVAKFDVIIDQAPTSPDQKQFVWAITAQVLQMGILPPQAVIELLKYSPYPESVVQEIRASMGLDGKEPPEKIAEKLQQAEAALKVMEQKLVEAVENAKTVEDDRAVEMMKLEIDEYKAETERLKARADARAKMVSAIATEDVGSEPSAASGGAAPQTGGDMTAVNARLDQLGEMLGTLLQAIGGGGQSMAGGEMPVPTEETM